MKNLIKFIIALLIIIGLGYFLYEKNFVQTTLVKDGECCTCTLHPEADVCCTCKETNILKKSVKGYELIFKKVGKK